MNQKALDLLLQMASKKVGTTPENLKSNLEKGDLSQVMGSMSTEDSQKLKNVLENKELTQKIISSPEAQELIKKLSGNK